MRDEICPYCSKDITGDYKHRCNQYHVALPKMPSELLLLATDPLMGKALAKWVVDVQSSTADQLREVQVKVLREAADDGKLMKCSGGVIQFELRRMADELEKQG